MDIIAAPASRTGLRRLVSASLLVALLFGAVSYYEQSWLGDALALDGPEAGVSVAAEPSPSPSPSPSPVPLPVPTSEPSPSPPPDPPPPAAEPAPAPAYPALPAASGAGRRVVYSNSAQRIWLVEGDGAVAASWLVSGRRGVPRPGNYGVFSKSRWSSARGGRVRMEFMVRFARGRSLAIGFHSIPVGRGGPIQTEGQLGTFRSAGCVRQLRANAETLWNWAPVGTRVVVTR